MRFFLVGIFYLCLVSSALAGVIGNVASIGFDTYIRSDCTVPMVVQITSDAAVPEDYSLQVVQYDRDGDEVSYSRPVAVNPGDQSFWTYFKPEPINGGLPSQQMGSASELAKRLRIFLATPDGSKRLVQISTAGRMPQMLDASDQLPGNKLILCIGRRPNVNEFDTSTVRTLGLRETVAMVTLDTRRLPDNALGYEAVDAVVWTDADPERLDAQQFRALRQYIRGGGRLIVIQNSETARMARLDEFLPVRMVRSEEFASLEPLRSLLLPKGTLLPVDPKTELPVDPFSDARPPFRMARAVAVPGAVIDTFVQWPDDQRTPYIARHLYGQGMVGWVAQDITDPSVRSISAGWPRLWDRVFDWNLPRIDFPGTAKRADLERFKTRWQTGGDKDLGAAFIEGLDLDSKTTALVSLAFVFFIGYWLIAGPGVHVVLAMRNRAQWSWFIFGAIALLATLLTVGLAQLVLRGAPQVRHVSLVRSRSDGNDSARVMSRFGIYVPRDASDMPVSISGRDTAAPAIISPLAVDPRYSGRNVSERDARHVVPITNEDASEELTIGVPIRSTLKKLQSEWSGQVAGRVIGTPRLIQTDESLIAGQLSNNTGRDLSRVLIVFSIPTPDGNQDHFIYMRLWQKGQTVQLDQLWNKAETKLSDGLTLPLSADFVRGQLRYAVNSFYQEKFRTGFLPGDTVPFKDNAQDYRWSFPMVSLFDRLAPMTNEGNSVNRVDLLRRGVRNWDCSAAISAGAMVVLAQSSNDAIPIPLTVDGVAPQGTGMTFWQFIVPLDRSQLKPPSTQPETTN
ncbi:MAG: hypothetical protein H7144_04220 [Burkholderiales bacterium]|nr:hypothetical protein [Phycisphaerae bacterium]